MLRIDRIAMCFWQREEEIPVILLRFKWKSRYSSYETFKKLY